MLTRHSHKDDLAARLRAPAERELRLAKDIAWLKDAMKTLLDERNLPHPEEKSRQ